LSLESTNIKTKNEGCVSQSMHLIIVQYKAQRNYAITRRELRTLTATIATVPKLSENPVMDKRFCFCV